MDGCMDVPCVYHVCSQKNRKPAARVVSNNSKKKGKGPGKTTTTDEKTTHRRQSSHRQAKQAAKESLQVVSRSSSSERDHDESEYEDQSGDSSSASSYSSDEDVALLEKTSTRTDTAAAELQSAAEDESSIQKQTTIYGYPKLIELSEGNTVGMYGGDNTDDYNDEQVWLGLILTIEKSRKTKKCGLMTVDFLQTGVENNYDGEWVVSTDDSDKMMHLKFSEVLFKVNWCDKNEKYMGAQAWSHIRKLVKKCYGIK